MNTDYTEMEYIGTQKEAIILDDGLYKGYRYIIVNYGSHPCAYVEIPKKHKYYKTDYRGDVENSICVHGGITFSGNLHLKNKSIANKRYYLGWDYGHYGDYIYYGNLPRRISYLFGNEGIKYTVEMIRKDVKNVIEQLLKTGGE